MLSGSCVSDRDDSRAFFAFLFPSQQIKLVYKVKLLFVSLLFHPKF
jgi:hypothetical protein